ncbi:hypothetical protein Bmur_0294 [Brachyspira murdochii DSM 12563]|uniref:DAHP synthase ferredoxin-like domain-containing protein n=1 Tax=Brachyspira murdochii (strain ATCC 51284 / DSM 12563 / 56-150) TaxID=526224 RepID=D5U5D2_BRAM5|nr:hypothetical protein Bmur_0294 [Brachyspira murdochii DSM 12563]
MIVVMKPNAKEEHINNIIERLIIVANKNCSF